MPFAREQPSGANAVCRGAELFLSHECWWIVANFFSFLPFSLILFCLPLPSISPPVPLPPKTLCLFFLSLVSVKDDSDFVFVSGKLQINYEEKPMIIKVEGGERRPSASVPAGVPRACPCQIPPGDATEREQRYNCQIRLYPPGQCSQGMETTGAPQGTAQAQLFPSRGGGRGGSEGCWALAAAEPPPTLAGGSRGGALRCRAGW